MTDSTAEGTSEPEATPEISDSPPDKETTEKITETKQATEEVVAPAPPPEIDSDYQPVEVNLRALLEAGAHYGHRVDKWNPKMLPYIYSQRSKIHIINLDVTLQMWEKARKFIVDITSRGGTVLFVGTKQQARKVAGSAARRCNAFYVNHRWLGGSLSNFQTIKKSFARMKKLEELLEQAEDKDSEVKIAKKERLGIVRQLEKLEVNLGGIRNMKKTPDLIFAIDIKKEAIAVSEARKLHIPVVALVDTNVDPTKVDFPIPCNDDAARTISLFFNAVADAVCEGNQAYELRLQKERAEEAKKIVKKEKPKAKVSVAEGAKNGSGKEAKKSKGTGTPEREEAKEGKEAETTAARQ